MTRVMFHLQPAEGAATPLGSMDLPHVPEPGDFVFLEAATHAVVSRGWRLTLTDELECDVVLRRLGRAAWIWEDAA